MKAMIDLGKGMMSMPMPWPMWIGLMTLTNAVAPIYFFETLEAKVVLTVFVLNTLVMTAIFASKGYVRLLGLGHILWIPLVAWLLARLGQVEPQSALGYWLIAVIVVNSLSVIIDAMDVLRYMRGEREPYIAQST